MSANLRPANFPALRALPALAVAVGLFLACSQSPQLTPASDAGGDANANANANATWGASACAGCVKRACSEERQACSSDSACVARVTCLDRCALGPSGDIDAACAAACPAGPSAATQAFETCRLREANGCAACGPVTANPDAGLSPLADKVLNQVCAPGTHADACKRCQESNCCDTRAACENDPACKPGLTECLTVCNAMPDGSATYRCKIDCYEKDLNATAELGSLLACMLAKCPSECGPYTACALCASAKCTSYHAECRATAECELIAKCRLAECPTGTITPECTKRCEARYPGGARLARDEEACVTLSCAKECR